MTGLTPYGGIERTVFAGTIVGRGEISSNYTLRLNDGEFLNAQDAVKYRLVPGWGVYLAATPNAYEDLRAELPGIIQTEWIKEGHDLQLLQIIELDFSPPFQQETTRTLTAHWNLFADSEQEFREGRYPKLDEGFSKRNPNVRFVIHRPDQFEGTDASREFLFALGRRVGPMYTVDTLDYMKNDILEMNDITRRLFDFGSCHRYHIRRHPEAYQQAAS